MIRFYLDKRVFINCFIVLTLCFNSVSVMSQGKHSFEQSIESKKLVKSYQDIANSFVQDYFILEPSSATGLGIHQFDAFVEDLSKTGLKRKVEIYSSYLNQLQKFSPEMLGLTDKQSADDLILLKNYLAGQIFDINVLKTYAKNPDLYPSLMCTSIYNLIIRDFAPLDVRAKDVIAREKKLVNLIKDAKSNLEVDLVPKIYVEICLEQLPAIINFFDKDVNTAFVNLKDKSIQSQIKIESVNVASSLKCYQEYLKHNLSNRVKGNFALGKDHFKQKLYYDEMIDDKLDDLLNMGMVELRNLQNNFKTIAHKINPNISPKEVIKQISLNHPKPDALVKSVAGNLDNIYKYCIDKNIVKIPGTILPTVEDTPPFYKALTFASMDSPGPFETKVIQAYYNVTVPDSSWNKSRIEEHMRLFNYPDIKITSIHEVYPGHYVQYLWLKSNSSLIRKIINCDSNVEGWAHYCEAMLLEEGYGDGNLELRLVQLHEALLRACRYIVAIKMHTQNMSVKTACDFFVKEGYQEPSNGLREAWRGTSDPTYLVYTYGKLKILALRKDYKQFCRDDYKLVNFHDDFLKIGPIPLSLLRSELLPDVRR